MSLDYQLLYSKRQTVAFVIKPDGQLVVRAPRRVSQAEIERLIRQKLDWINKHQGVAARSRGKPKQYIEGETFWFLGEERPLKLVDEYRTKLGYENGTFLLSRFKSHKPKPLFEAWYRNQAKQLLMQRAQYWAPKMMVSYKKLTVTGANTRWGSCSAKGTINFSWRLVMAPLDVLDYVVIHELAHLVHHNHSAKFWQLVGQFCPGFLNARKWLRIRGRFFVLP